MEAAIATEAVLSDEQLLQIVAADTQEQAAATAAALLEVLGSAEADNDDDDDPMPRISLTMARSFADKLLFFVGDNMASFSESENEALKALSAKLTDMVIANVASAKQTTIGDLFDRSKCI